MAVFDNGMAPITESVKDDVANVPRSAFNMSRIVNCNGIIGALMPIDILETVPNEDYTINYGVLATTRNPLVRKLNNGMKIYLHSYWCPKRELWKGWDNYLTKGRSGTVNLEVPKLYPVLNKAITAGKENDPTDSSWDYASTDIDTRVPFAPSSYMGLPIANFGDETSGAKVINKFMPAKTTSTNVINNSYSNNKSGAKWEINALPFVMYNKIYRDYYMNQNLVQDVKNWFPDDEDEWILPYNQKWVNNVKGFDRDTTSFANALLNPSSQVYVPTNSSTIQSWNTPTLNILHFRSYKGDYFTTANPFEDLLRGDKSALSVSASVNLDLSDLVNELDPTSIFTPTAGAGYYQFTANDKAITTNKFALTSASPVSWGFADGDGTDVTALKSAMEMVKTKYKSGGSASLGGVSLSALRKCAVLEKYMQRMATTNGTYREMVGQLFGYKPNVYDRKPRYIGGCAQDMTFSEIVQTSATNGTDYLGKTGSRGMCAGLGNIGKFHSDDYGYIMTIASIVPDTYYSQQGIETMWTRTTQDKEYQPLSNNLDPQPILEKELYVGDSTHFNDVFGWTERNADMKSRQNIITGLGACGSKAQYDSYNFMRREFNTYPTLNAKFLAMTTDNVDMKPFMSANEPPFDLMIGCNIDKVSPMPYTTKPADLGIKY